MIDASLSVPVSLTPNDAADLSNIVVVILCLSNLETVLQMLPTK
jgi:hypothetical protein